MDEWTKIQDIYRKRELIGILGIIVCIIVGVIFDWSVIYKENILIQMDDISSFSLTLLQIQATVATLIFTVITLITGYISDSYMGVSISDFYLNIKLWKLTQKSLIIMSLGLCLTGILAYSFGMYNSVFYLFIGSLIVILISIQGMYSVFCKSGSNQDKEIEAYLNYMLARDIEYEEKLSIYKSFVIDWKKAVESQNRQTYEEHFEIFKKCMLELWKYKTKEALSDIEQQCYSMAYCLLSLEKKILKGKGIEFVQEIYTQLWKLINNSNNESQSRWYKCEFSFFEDIYDEIKCSIDEMNVEEVEKRLYFGELADLILRVSMWINSNKGVSDKEKEANFKRRKYNYNSENMELCYLAQYIGYYLRKGKNKNNLIDERIWINTLKECNYFYAYNIPEERKEDFLRAKVNVSFCYCYGMIVNGQENIVKEGLYFSGMKNIVKIDTKYQAILYLVVHSYVYYLAVRESDSCVSKDIRQSALNIWDDPKVQSSFFKFLKLLSNNPDLLDLNTFAQMVEIVFRFELFPRYEFSKNMIIESVTLDFYLFIILFMSREFFLPELLERNIDDMQAFSYVSSGNADQTKGMLSKLLKMTLTVKKSEEEINQTVGLMYDDLEKMVKKKQKERYIKLAKEAQEDYKTNINEEKICEKIKSDVIKNIKEKFASILVESDERNGIIRVDLLKVIAPTSSIECTKITDGYYSHMDGMFLLGIGKFLYQRNTVEYKKRIDDFVNDKEFMKYLDVNKLHLLLGSQYVFQNKDSRMRTAFKDFLDDYETVYTDIIKNGVALKKNAVEVCLHDINVSIHPSTINEENVQYDIETKKYYSSILNGLLIDFDEDELRELLYNNYKVINVTAKISIQVNELPCGTIFSIEP